MFPNSSQTNLINVVLFELPSFLPFPSSPPPGRGDHPQVPLDLRGCGQPGGVQRSSVPRVARRLGHLEGGDDGDPTVPMARETDEPLDGHQLSVQQVVVVEGLVADGGAWPP